MIGLSEMLDIGHFLAMIEAQIGCSFRSGSQIGEVAQLARAEDS